MSGNVTNVTSSDQDNYLTPTFTTAYTKVLEYLQQSSLSSSFSLTSTFTIAYTGSTGYINGGLQGLISTGSISIIDQYLINNQYYNKNYLSLYSYWHHLFAYGIKGTTLTVKAIFKATLPMKDVDGNIDRMANALIYILPAFQTHFANDFLDLKEKTLVPMQALSLINKIYDKDNALSTDNRNKLYQDLCKNPSNAHVTIGNYLYKIYENNFQTSYIKIFALSIANEGINYIITRYLLGDNINDIFSKFVIRDKLPFEVLQSITFQQILDVIFKQKTEETEPMPLIKRQPSAVLLEKIDKKCKERFLDQESNVEQMKQISSEIISEIIHDSTKNYAWGVFKFSALFGLRIFSDSYLKKYVSKERQKIQTILINNSQNITKNYEQDHQGKTLLSSHKDIFIQHNKDISNAFGVAFKVNEIAADSIKSLSSYQMVMSNIPELFIYNAIASPIIQIFLQRYLDHSRKISKELSAMEALEKQISYSIANNIESIKLGDGLNHIFDKQINITCSKSQLYTEETNIPIDIESLKQYEYLYYVVIGSPYLFFKFTQSPELFTMSLFNILSSTNQIMLFNLYNIRSKIGTTKEEISLFNLESFYNIINKPEENPTIYTTNYQDNEIIYSNYSVYKGNLTIIHVENLAFNLSKKHLIKDHTLVYFFKNLKKALFTPFSSSGVISIPKPTGQDLTTIYIDQNPYFPEGLTLLESIYFPKRLDNLSEEEVKDLRIKIIDLFSKFTNGKNDHIEAISDLHNHNFKLKPEQAKKSLIIRAILHNADIIIMDETFTGLDSRSVKEIQTAINFYLPNVTIFSFDKHPINNSLFYNYEVSYDNDTFVQTEIKPDYSVAIYEEVEVVIQGNCQITSNHD
jgi:hypothetical protein